MADQKIFDSDSIQGMIDEAVAENVKDLVSRSHFMRRMREVTVLANKDRISSGISGQDMIDDISRILGEDWKT